MPNWEFAGLGYTIPFNVLVPTVIMPGIIFTLLALYPWLEARFTGDHEYHNLLDRPRDVPVRTAIGAMSISFYIVLMLSGGNDVIAAIFQVSVNSTTYVGRTALFVVPPLVYFITKRWCLALQRSDDELVHHGIESGTIRRLPSGEFIEETVELPAVYRVGLTGVQAPELEAGHAAPEPVAPRGGFFRGPKQVEAPVDTRAKAPQPELERSGRPAKPE